MTGNRAMKLRAALLFLAAAGFAAGPFMFPGFGGYDPEAFPLPQRDPPIQPEGYAFAIWGPIYLWLALMAAVGLALRAKDPDWDRTRRPLLASLAVGAVWLPVAIRGPVVATALVWVMLVTALAALRLVPRRDRWLLGGPVALYAGWLSVAAFSGLGLVLAGYGIVPGGRAAAWILLPLAIVLVAAVQWWRPWLPEYGLAAGWGLAGVVVANATGQSDVAFLAGFGIVAVGAVLWLRRRTIRRP